MDTITQDINNKCIIKNYGTTDLIDTEDKLKSGYTPVQYDAIVAVSTQKITDELSQITASALTGADGDNTDYSTVYVKISVSGSDNLVEIFSDSDRASGNLVANGTDTSKAGGAVTLSAQNASGLAGTITLVATAAAEAASSIEIIEEIDRYDSAVSDQIVKGIAKEYVAANGMIEVYTRCDANLSEVGKDSVTDKFTKAVMILLFRESGIELI